MDDTDEEEEEEEEEDTRIDFFNGCGAIRRNGLALHDGGGAVNKVSADFAKSFN